MKNICFFNTIPSWGGGEKWHFEMASYIASLNYKVLFYTEKGGVLDKKITNSFIEKAYVTLTNFSYLNTNKVNKAAKVLKDHKIDIIIFNSSKDIKFGGLAAKKAGIKHIIYRRGSAIPIKNSFINRYFFSQVLTDVLANSYATKATINQNNSSLFPQDKITVIANGIDTSSFLEAKIKSENRDKDIFTLGNLGRLVKQKHQIFLLEVAKELKEKGLKFKIIIGGDGVLKEKLYQKRKDYQLEKEVEFVGFVDDSKSFMYKIDVFLLSSLWEGFGYVIAEAMLCKKPVIAFNVSSNPELVIDEENGFLTQKEDLNDFVNKILKLYHNQSLIKEMGEKGQHKIISEFDSSVARKRFENYIESF